MADETASNPRPETTPFLIDGASGMRRAIAREMERAEGRVPGTVWIDEAGNPVVMPPQDMPHG